MPPSAKIIQLHELLAARGLAGVARSRQRLVLGWPALEEAADGGAGLPKGDIAELHCPRQGGALAVERLLGAAHAARRCVALIDGADGFDPVRHAAPQLARLLWVRCRGAGEAVQAADLLLRDGNLPLVLMNLRGCTDAVRVPGQAWYRLQRLVEQSGATLLVLTPRPMIPSARVRMALEHAYTLDDLDREAGELTAALVFTPSRVTGRRSEEPLLAEVG